METYLKDIWEIIMSGIMVTCRPRSWANEISLAVRCRQALCKCGLPETYETIEFNERGVCNVCLQREHRDEAIDWVARKGMLDQLIEEYRGKTTYDAIVPFSGGKIQLGRLLFNERV